MSKWIDRINKREIYEIRHCEKVPLIEASSEILELSNEYVEHDLYNIELLDDIYAYYNYKDILKIEELIEGSAKIKLGFDTTKNAKEWLLGVVNWFAGNRWDLKDEDIKLDNRLRGWYQIGVILIIPEKLKPKFDEFYEMAKKFGWIVDIKNDAIYKTTLEGKEVYVVGLTGDVVNERLDNILSGGGVFDLEKRVVCDDEWITGWLVRDINIDNRYAEGIVDAEFQVPGMSGYFSGESLNTRKNYKKEHDSLGNELLKMIDDVLGSKSESYQVLYNRMKDAKDDFKGIIKLIDKIDYNLKKLENAIHEKDISEPNKILDDLENNVYEIEDYIVATKRLNYKPAFNQIIDILNDGKLDGEMIKAVKDMHELSQNIVKIKELLISISEYMGKIKRFANNEDFPNEIIRRLNILNNLIEKTYFNIAIIEDNEIKTMNCALSNLCEVYLQNDNEKKKALLNETKNIIDTLYFDTYDFLKENFDEYLFKFVMGLASISLTYDYAEELKKEDNEGLFDYAIIKFLENSGFGVKEYSIINILLNIRKNLSLLCGKRHEKYFDKKLMIIIRSLFDSTGKNELYENIGRLQKFVENLILINQILEEACKNRNHAEVKGLVKNCFGAELKSEELLEISNKIAILDG
jgi:hypothetical protein